MSRTVKTPPILPGGIYKRVMTSGVEVVGIIYATIKSVRLDQRDGAPVEGTLCVHGEAEQVVIENDESFKGWTLVYAPTLWSADRHVSGETAGLSEEEKLRARVAELESRLMEQASTAPVESPPIEHKPEPSTTSETTSTRRAPTKKGR